MNIQEAKICNQMRYPVIVTGTLDTFGYYKPDEKTNFIIHAIRESYNSEMKSFVNTLVISIPDSNATYTISNNDVQPAPGFEKLLQKDVKKIKAERLERVVASLINEGKTKSDINDAIKAVWNKAQKSAPVLSDDEKDDIKNIIDYLNKRAGTAYRPSSKNTQRHIKARFREGYIVEDFNKVIDNKVADWRSDEKMSKYLNPDTLFGTNFEKYLNQQPAQKKDKLHSKPSFDIDELAKKAKYNEDYDI